MTEADPGPNGEGGRRRLPFLAIGLTLGGLLLAVGLLMLALGASDDESPAGSGGDQAAEDERACERVTVRATGSDDASATLSFKTRKPIEATEHGVATQVVRGGGLIAANATVTMRGSVTGAARATATETASASASASARACAMGISPEVARSRARAEARRRARDTAQRRADKAAEAAAQRKARAGARRKAQLDAKSQADYAANIRLIALQNAARRKADQRARIRALQQAKEEVRRAPRSPIRRQTPKKKRRPRH